MRRVRAGRAQAHKPAAPSEARSPSKASGGGTSIQPEQANLSQSLVANKTFNTGARQVLDPSDIRSWDAAEDAYKVIKSDASDISAIAKNTGFSESRIERIKNHVFVNEHKLDLGVRQFDADPEIVNAWSRLKTGDFVQSDINLLRHEIFESKFEGIFRTDYRTAHEAAIRANRLWNPE